MVDLGIGVVLIFCNKSEHPFMVLIQELLYPLFNIEREVKYISMANNTRMKVIRIWRTHMKLGSVPYTFNGTGRFLFIFLISNFSQELILLFLQFTKMKY